MKPKKDIEYPLIRLPKEYKDLIGKEALIYEIGKNKFLITVNEDSEDELYNWLYNQLDFSKIDKNLLERAKELGIDISSLIEEKLRELIDESKHAEAGIRTRDLRIMSPSPQPARPPRLGYMLLTDY